MAVGSGVVSIEGDTWAVPFRIRLLRDDEPRGL